MDETVYKRSSKARKMKSDEAKSFKLKFKNRTVDAARTVAIGRGESNDVVLDKDSLVSRRHALIEQKGDSFTIRDLGSTNGTYVNGNPLREKEERTLKPGDVIRTGNTEFSFLGSGG